MGRKRIYTDREIALAKLCTKLARNSFAIVDYDLRLIHADVLTKPITDAEKKKLKKACSIAIDEALRIKK